jgi:hypothetical protein
MGTNQDFIYKRQQLYQEEEQTMPFEVTANISGRKGAKRTQSTMNFKTRADAKKYAEETNRWRPGANARVVHTKTNQGGK